MTEQKQEHEMEKEILKFWKDKNIYKKSVEKNKNGKGFYMMDGPPYATGHIHMGTALNKISKDIAMRSRRLQGFAVADRPGYDTHGVPIEFKVEKAQGFKSKQDIEKFGVKKFIEECKKFATEYIDVMNNEFVNLGTWFNYDDPYLTLAPEYVETIWDTFKEADKKGLLYLGKYPIHICPRCETAVAFNEIEYAKQTDTSIFVKFPIKNEKNKFLVIWTTTPWTLPANTGVMVHPDVEYQELQLTSGEVWIIAKPLAPKIMAELEMGFTILREFKGKDLEGTEYTNPLAKHIKVKPKNSYRVICSARFVTTEDGTGLVHCAPGHGKEDYEAGKENGLDAISPVDINGILTKEAGKYAGKKARIVDAEIISDLENDGMLVYKKSYSHDYPQCWRCHSPLLMISQPQWFLKISGIQKELLKENENTTWLPKWAQLRMKAWLEGISDWPISRNRYWGTPLPIWVCDKCEKKKVVGSIHELEKLSGKKIKEVHKPEIDKVTIPCECGNKMKRTSGVLDVWFDSGVSSWAALRYTKDKTDFEKFWPADLNFEGKDQIRGWWNSQMILSQIKFGKKPFKTIAMHGMILDIGKKKMSKSEGNVISPQDIIEKYSRDHLRYYFAKTSKGDDFAFKEDEFREIQKVFVILANVNNFVNQLNPTKHKQQIEDKWILSRYNQTINEITEKYNTYEFPEVVKILENFLVNDLSKTYIKLIRERSDECYEVLNTIRLGVLTLLAPICPFLTEKIWQKLRENKIVDEESIHLAEFPKSNKKLIDEELEKTFEVVLTIIEKGLAKRDEAKVGLKWPLPKLTIKTKLEIKEFEEIIKSQLNVKSIKIDNKQEELDVELDTKMTPELEAEGFAREITRSIQSLRKQAGLQKDDAINLYIQSEFNDKLEAQKEGIKEKVGAKKLTFGKSQGKHALEGKIKDLAFKISLDKP